MNLRIEVAGPATERTVNNNGKSFTVRSQPGLLWKAGEKYPDKFEIPIDRDQSPYQIGNYALAEQNIEIDRFGKLQMQKYRLELRPITQATAKAG